MDKSNFRDLQLIQNQYEMDYHNRLTCVIKDLESEIESRVNYFFDHKDEFYKKSWNKTEDKLIAILSEMPREVECDKDWHFHRNVPHFGNYRLYRGESGLTRIKKMYYLLDQYDKHISGLKRKPVKEV